MHNHSSRTTNADMWRAQVATEVQASHAAGGADRAVLCCGTGMGMAIIANKQPLVGGGSNGQQGLHVRQMGSDGDGGKQRGSKQVASSVTQGLRARLPLQCIQFRVCAALA